MSIDKYDLTPQERMIVYRNRINIQNDVCRNAKKAEEFFNARKEYVLEGLELMPKEKIVIGNTKAAKLALEEEALFSHIAPTKKEYIEHICSDDLKPLIEDDLINTRELIEELQTYCSICHTGVLDGNTTTLIAGNITQQFDFDRNDIESVKTKLKDDIRKKMFEELKEVFGEDKIKHICDQIDPNSDNLRVVIKAFINAEMESSATHGDDEPAYLMHPTFCGGLPLIPLTLMSLERYRFLLDFCTQAGDLSEKDRNVFLDKVLDDFEEDAVFSSLLTVLAHRFKDNPNNDISTLLDRLDDDKLNPYMARKVIKDQPGKYYITAAFNAIYLALIKESVAEDTRVALKQRLSSASTNISWQKKYLELTEENVKLKDKNKELELVNARKTDNIHKQTVKIKEQEKEIKELRERLNKLEKDHDEGQKEPAYKDAIKLEQDRSEQAKAQKQVLAKENMELKQKIEVLQSALNEQNPDDRHILELRIGEESELYTNEFASVIEDVLEEALTTSKKYSRRYDVIKSLLDANHQSAPLREKRERTKQILKGTRGATKQITEQLKDVGVTFLGESGKHVKYNYYNDQRYLVVISKTSSDNRSGINVAQNIIETML